MKNCDFEKNMMWTKCINVKFVKKTYLVEAEETSVFIQSKQESVNLSPATHTDCLS